MKEKYDNHSQHTIVLPTVAAGASSQEKIKLMITAGPLQGREFIVNKDVFTIGSGLKNDLSIADSTISKRHCQLNLTDNVLTITDLDSTNGTSIEGVKVKSARLSPNTEVQIGRTRFIAPFSQVKQTLQVSSRELFGTCVGRSILMRHVFFLAEQAVSTNSPVLLIGENGTGKEALAEDIHIQGACGEAPFIVVDCSDDPTKESFTADLKLAEGGSIFIDHIELMGKELQSVLLRIMEKNPAIRVFCSTTGNLQQLVKEKKFRDDLFFKISVLVIELPALKRRKDDISLLLRTIALRLKISDETKRWLEQDSTLSFLKRYDWPGNVQELRNLVERIHYNGCLPSDLTTFLQANYLSEKANDTPEFMVSADRPFKDAKSTIIAEFERRYLDDLLSRNSRNISQSAREAGIERAYLQRLIRKYGMRNGDQ